MSTLVATYKKLVSHSIWKDKLFINFIKLVLFLAFVYFIYYQITRRDNIEAIKTAFLARLESGNIIYLIITCLLIPVNWSLEAIKWQYLTKPIQKMGWKGSLLGVLSGVTLSLFTPARIGEFGGRLINIKAANRGKVLIANIIGSYSQLVIIISLGIVSLSLYLTYQIGLKPLFSNLIIGGGIFICFILIIIYFNIGLIIRVLQKFKVPSKLISILSVMSRYSHSRLLKILCLSFSRYFVYTTQAVLIYLFFGIDTKLIEYYVNISIGFLSQTFIPIPTFLDLPVRGGLSIWIWDYLDIDALTLSSIPFILWLLNICMPASLGMILISIYDRSKS